MGKKNVLKFCTYNIENIAFKIDPRSTLYEEFFLNKNIVNSYQHHTSLHILILPIINR